jgi:hypothetical protein
MNPDLQAQTDAMTKAISHLETSLHHDLITVGGGLAALLVIIIIVLLLSRVRIHR